MTDLSSFCLISPLSMFYIPFYHTLAQESKETILKVKTELVQHENETEFVSTEHSIPVEKVVKYIPAGNHKWFVLCFRKLGMFILKLDI